MIASVSATPVGITESEGGKGKERTSDEMGFLSIVKKVNDLKRQLFQLNKQFEEKYEITQEEFDIYHAKKEELQKKLSKWQDNTTLRDPEFVQKALQALFGKEDPDDYPKYELPEGLLFRARPDLLGDNPIVTGLDHFGRKFYLISSRISDDFGKRMCLHTIFQEAKAENKWLYDWYRDSLTDLMDEEMEKKEKFSANAFSFYLGYGIGESAKTFIQQGDIPNTELFESLHKLITEGNSHFTFLRPFRDAKNKLWDLQIIEAQTLT